MKFALLASILVSGILNLIMGVVIIAGSKERSKSLPFALFSFSTFLLALSYYFIHNSEFPVSVRFSYSLGALIPTFLLAWIYQYSSNNPRKWVVILIYTIGTLFVLLPFVDGLVITDIQKNAFLGFVEQQGVLFPLYSGFFIVAYLIVLVKLVQLSVYAEGEEIKRNRIILAGFSIYGGLGILFGLVLPFLGYEQFTDLDVTSSIIFVGFTSYAILHYRWMNIKVVAAEILSALISGMALLEVFIVETTVQRIYKIGVFMIVSTLSALMVRSIIREAKRKEELQKLFDKLTVDNGELQKISSAKTDFISMATHQMRTPLTAAKGFLSLFLEGSFGELSPTQKKTLQMLDTNNNRMANLIEDLLSVSKIESGHMEFKFSKCHIENICQEVIDGLTLKAKDRNLYLKYETPKEPLPELLIDGPKVREVISNLVDNAVKYTPSGGVTLKIQIRPRSTGESSDQVRVTVTDTGIGIPDTELPHLFVKFSRGKDLSRLNAGGTGLGLYVAKTMIENNGGKIWAESDGDGKGSRFIVEIPVERANAQRATSNWGGPGEFLG